jgi:Lipocalin-like domain
MKCLLRYAACAVLSIFLNGAASADPIPPQLIGTWRLVSNTLEEVASGRKTDLMGKDPIGFISYGADGRMMILQVRSDRMKPKGPVPTPSEAETLFKSFLGYAGTGPIRSAAARSRIMSICPGTRPGPAPTRSELFRFKAIA